MSNQTRRVFLTALLAPLVAKLVRQPDILKVVNGGINPNWDGRFPSASPDDYASIYAVIEKRITEANLQLGRMLAESFLVRGTGFNRWTPGKEMNPYRLRRETYRNLDPGRLPL